MQICFDLVLVGFTSIACHSESAGATVPFDVKTPSGWKLANDVSGAVRISHSLSGSQLTVNYLLSLLAIDNRNRVVIPLSPIVFIFSWSQFH